MPSDVHIEQQQSLSQFKHLSSPPSPSSSSSSSSTTTTTSVKERRSMSEQTDINISGCTMIDGQPESIYMQRYKALRDAGFDETTANKYSPLYSSVNEVIDAILSQSLNDNLTTNGGRTIMAKKGIDNNSYSTAIYCNGNNKSSTIMNYNDTSAINAAELLSELTDSISMNKTNNNNNNNLIMECIHGQSPSSTSSKSFLYMSNGDSNGSVINSNDLISCSSNESFHNHSHINADGNYLSLSNCIGNSHRNSLMKNTIFSSESSESSTDNNRSNSSNLIVTMLKDGLLEDSSDEITLEDDVGLLADGQNGNGSSSSPSTSSSLSSGISSSFFMDTSSSSPSSFSSLSSSISISPPSNQSIVANFEQQQQRQSTNNNNGNHHQTLTNDNGTLISLFLSKQQQQKSSNNNNNVQNNGKIKSTSAKTITTMMMNDSNDIIISNGYNNNNNNRMHNGINKNNNNNETNDLNCETFSFSLDNLSTSSSSSTSSSLSSNTTTMESNQQKNGEQTFDGLLENHHHSMIIGNNKLSFNSNNRLSMKLYGNGNDSAENSHHHHHHHYQQNNNNKLLHPVNGNNSDSVPVVEPNSFNDTGHISGVDGGHHYRHNLHFPSTTMIDKFNVDSGCTDLLFDNHDQQNPKTTNGLMMKSCQPITVAAGYRNSDDTLNDLLGYLNLQQQLFTNNQPQQQQQQQHLQYGNNFDHRNCSITFADIAASSLNGHHSNGVHNNNGNNVLNSSGSGSNNIDLVDSSSFLSILDSPTHKSLNCSNNGNNGTSNGYFNAFTSSSNIPVANTIQSFYDQFNTEQNGLNKKFYRKQQQTQALNFRPIGASPLSPSMNVNDANKLLKSGQIKESQLGFIRSSNGSLTITDCGGHIGIGDNGFESNGITMNENNTQSPNRPTNLMGYKGLWVCNVSPEVGLHYLKRRFRRYGHFTGIQTFERRATNGTNIVFVHYDNPNSPVEAIAALHNYNGQDLCADPNEPLKLRFAPSMEQSRAGQLPTLEQARKIVEKSGECFNWRLSSGCHRGQRCHLKHVSINKEIDSQPWVKALKKKINET
ncbi:hypothetical protein HUG17_7013 [Dermatophagoides farinae]|uniref:RRM domain-containing protein n=1 Tax=Dermatophagoides farinae TaxID=6954 RepID=A0A9D4NRX7_DERFA|nr:hypothetical protein HUG17_7013 [Dermatophagoides farinae]